AIPTLPERFRWRRGPGVRTKQTQADGEELHPRVVYCAGAARKYEVLVMCCTTRHNLCLPREVRAVNVLLAEIFTRTEVV
ncbi:MAG TPA: hypothetical protein VNX66_19210, partial [Candidatus Sulfotelmatobacter sp.]|nr:hypothetical protein [Candidatus Sulfotelmatobacter sp.]